MLENLIEKQLRVRVERLGGKAYKFESPGNRGMPDRIICLPGGKVVFVETKRPKGGRLSGMQKYRIEQLRRIGMDVRVIFTMQQIEEFIAEIAKGGDANEIQAT